MKKEFLGYVLAVVCAGIYMRVAAASQVKAGDVTTQSSVLDH